MKKSKKELEIGENLKESVRDIMFYATMIVALVITTKL